MARKGLNIYKRKDGRWEARYIKSRNTQGKPRYGYLYATSYHEVRNNLQRVIQAMNTYDAEKVPATNCKFMGFSAIWLENSSTSLKESTYIRYRTLLPSVFWVFLFPFGAGIAKPPFPVPPCGAGDFFFLQPSADIVRTMTV